MSTGAGRPTDYSADLATLICDRLATGESLRSICSDPALPDKSTVFRWLAKHDEFRDQYARAREAQADFLAEEVIEIADDASRDLAEKDLGDGSTVAVVDHEHIARSRLRVDARKWFVGKVAPKKYGDRVALTGGDGGAVKIAHELLSPDELERRIGEVAAEVGLTVAVRGVDGADGAAGGEEAPSGTDQDPPPVS